MGHPPWRTIEELRSYVLLPIGELDVPPRVMRHLVVAGVATIGELVRTSSAVLEALIKQPGVGLKTYWSIRRAMAAMGLPYAVDLTELLALDALCWSDPYGPKATPEMLARRGRVTAHSRDGALVGRSDEYAFECERSPE